MFIFNMESVPAMGDIPIEKESRENPWKKVWIALGVLLVIVLGVSVYEYFRITPRDVRFTNITSSSVTVSWNTKSPTSASVLVFKENTLFPLTILGLGGERFYDTRDVRIAELNAASEAGMNRDDLSLTMDDFQTEVVVEDMGEYYTHHVTITGLESETEYSFMVGDRSLFRRVEDINRAEVVKTLVVPQSIETPYPAYGSVKNAEGSYEKPIDQLIPVSDAIVYLSYYDKVTGESSSVYSSSVTEEGNWYIDVSMARDSSGRPFLETYGGVDSEIFVDLVVDAGQYGVWDTRTEDLSISPAEPIVVNFPEKVNVIDGQNPMGRQGEEFGLLSNPFVQGVLAARPVGNTPSGCAAANACQFINYCGPCQRQCADGYWYDCSCDTQTLANRNCSGTELPPSENPVTCGGSALGTVSKYGSDCKVCSKRLSNGYYIGAWETDNTTYDPAKNCAKRDTCTSRTCEQASNGTYVYSSETACKTGGYSCSSSAFGDGCSGTLTCWKRRTGVCTPKTCASAGEGEGYIYSSKENCQTGGHACSSKGFGDGCGKTLTCWKSVQETCISKRCAELDDTYDLDACSSVPGKMICYSKRITDNCGKFKTCYNGIGIYVPPTPEPNPTPGPTPTPSPTPGPTPTPSPTPGPIIPTPTPPESQNKIPVMANPSIQAGKQCPEKDLSGNEVGFCSCKDGADHGRIRYPGEWCRQIKLALTIVGMGNPYWRKCETTAQEGDVCWENGTTCKYGTQGDVLYCNGAPPSSLNLPEEDPMELFSSNKYVKGVYAQEQGIQYLLNSETGMFVDLPLGAYVVEYEGETYSIRVDNAGEQVQTLLYMDVNENGQYDEGVDKNIGEDAAVLNISPVELIYNYSLKEGFNFVTFPFLIQTDYDVSSAAALLLELNERYDNAIYSISKYDGRWRIVGQNSELYDINDFQLLPGQGYVIKAKEDVSITLTGQPVKYETTADSAPITLFEGWNLIGLYGTGVKTYTAKTMIADINASNFTADNVTKWARDKQMYEGFQSSEGQEYGFDYPINSLESYFVRILEGRGNWQPKLRMQK